MKNVKFTEKIEIHCTPEFAFDFTQDYSQRLIWDTFLKKADLIGGATQASTGVKAYCVAKNGLGMETEYVSFNRPKVTAIRMTKGPFLYKAFFGSWTFKALNDSTTEVLFLYSFQLRFPFSLMESWIKANLQANVRQRLIDLKTNIELQTQPASAVQKSSLKPLDPSKPVYDTKQKLKIENKYTGQLPSYYLNFLKENPQGDGITFNEHADEDPDFEGRYWNIMGESELLENWEMTGVGRASNFECLKLYVQVQREFAQGDQTTSNVGNIELNRVESGFIIGDENGDYLYLDPDDNFSVWIYYHDGGDVCRIADSFKELNPSK